MPLVILLCFLEAQHI